MVNWRVNLWVLCVCTVFTSASYTMIIPFLPVYLLEIGVLDQDVAMWSGAVFSVSFLVGGIMAPIWGKIADKSGKKPMALRAGFCLTVVYALGAFVQSPEQLFCVRILQGFANGFMPASLALVATGTPQKELGMSLGIMQTGNIVGSVLGPLLGGSLAHIFGMRVSFLIAGAFLFVAAVAVAVFVKETKPEQSGAAKSSMLDDFKASLHNSILMEMLVLTVVVQIAILILQPVVTLYIAELQGGVGDAVLAAGIIFSMGGIAGAFAAPFWGRFGQTSGYFKAMTIAFIGAGVFNFMQYFPTSVWGFGVLQFFVGMFIVGVNPSISALLVNSTKADFRGRAFGIATTANQFGSMIGPLVGGAISASLGIRYVFLFTGTLLFLIGVTVYLRHRARQSARNG